MNPIYQEKMKNFINSYPNNGVMIPIYGNTEQFGADTFFQCIIAPIEFAQKDMESNNINDWPKPLSPGFTQYGGGDDADIVYSRYNNDKNIEPLIIERDFHGLGVSNQVEVVEEFRLLNNLYFDANKNEYRDLETEIVVVKIDNYNFVSVHKRYLKRYLSVKSSVLIIHISSIYFSPSIDESLKMEHSSYDSGDKVGTFLMHIDSGKQFSMIYSKTLISGVPINDCGYWPYEDADRQYETFIVGLDEDGNEVSHSSNPDQLNNWFDVHPDKPQYLTPIFFRREVLQKYYDAPTRYSIEDGILRFGTIWSLYIDNHQDDYVSAYLGDLGRYLPNVQEQQHWKNYNIAIDGSISNTKFKRDFEAIFAPPDSPIFIFQNEYKKVNQEFNQKLGWPLFLTLHDDDEYNFTGLRLPLSNSHTEFDSLVLALVKVLIDSLNEEQIKAKITDGITGSISRLEKWMEIMSIPEYQIHIKFLRNLQNLRSCTAGHRKGKGYTKIMNELQISNDNLKLGFKSLVVKSTEFLSLIRKHLNLFT